MRRNDFGLLEPDIISVVRSITSDYDTKPLVDYLENHNSGIPDIKDMDLDEVKRHHTCGNCKYDTVPEKDAPCVDCIHSVDMRKDLWQPKGE